VVALFVGTPVGPLREKRTHGLLAGRANALEPIKVTPTETELGQENWDTPINHQLTTATNHTRDYTRHRTRPSHR
jgi:hypothetical protein